MKKERILKVIFFLIIGILIITGYYFINKYLHLYIPCMINKITHLYCPGCGTTRMLFALLKGHIYEAFMYNQFVFILLPFILLYILYKIYCYIEDKKAIILKKIPNWCYIILLIVTISWGIIRNFIDFLQP